MPQLENPTPINMQVASNKHVFWGKWWNNLIFQKKHYITLQIIAQSLLFMSYNKIHIIFMSFHLITFECYHDNISYYKILASKSLRLCRYPPYPRQQHGCPLVRIHLLSNFVVHSVSFSENYRNHQNHDFNFLFGPRIKEIRETRIYPVQ